MIPAWNPALIGWLAKFKPQILSLQNNHDKDMTESECIEVGETEIWMYINVSDL